MKKKQASNKRVSPATTNNPGAQVDYCRAELNAFLPAYYMIRDAIEGELAIKGFSGSQSALPAGAGNGGLPLSFTNIIVSRAIRYLPQPNAADRSADNLERYKAYVTRAVFYNVTARTLEGMAGQIFLRDPIVSIPTELEVMRDNSDGNGLTLDQTALRCVRNCISYGRTGILVDYPVTEGPTTKADVANGEIRPTFTTYHPWDILNWRTMMVGAKRVLTMVVLREYLDNDDSDGFAISTFPQYRVLRLDPDNGNHYVELYHNEGKAGFQLQDTQFPKDSKGVSLTYIPFHFIGSENNNESPDKPPLYDLASLNIAHYRNSADYEESCFIVGQPTPVLIGLSEDWVKNILKDTVPLGSRASIPLPVGADAKLLQAAENSMPIEAMKAKEAQMVAIGAKLVQVQKVAKTATQQIIETTAESSPLANIAKNVSSAMLWALKVAASFVGAASDSIKYDLNKDFDLTSMTADDQNAVILQWQSGAIGFSEMRTVLRRAGTATLTDDKAREEIKADITAGMVPDPSAGANALAGGSMPATASGAGGPQPKAIRRQSSPAGSK